MKFLLPLLALSLLPAWPAETITDVGDFGSNEPAPREDLPTRGHVVVPGKDWVFSNQTHWHEYTANTTLKRWGAYQVKITYTSKIPVRLQFRSGETIFKVPLKESPEARQSHLGEITFAEAGAQTLVIFTPQIPDPTQFVIQEIRLVPAYEGDKSLQAQDGSIVLEAKTAATWSENLRYEPKPEKNCLGFWTDPADWAEWEMEITRPGRFTVEVWQGCGTDGGSVMEIASGSSATQFSVKPTGGFQKWEMVSAGEIEIGTAGTHRLAIKAIEKKGGAIMDVQKIVLKPKA